MSSDQSSDRAVRMLATGLQVKRDYTQPLPRSKEYPFLTLPIASLPPSGEKTYCRSTSTDWGIPFGRLPHLHTSI